MGLLENLFKSKPDGLGEKALELVLSPPPAEPGTRPPAEASDESVEQNFSAQFLHPKDRVPRAANPIIPGQRPGGAAARPERKAPLPARSSAPESAADEVILTVADLVRGIPPQYLRAVLPDLKREVRFRLDQLSSDFGRGRSSVALSTIASLCPDIFVQAIGGAEDQEVRLPLQKLVEQIVRIQSRGGSRLTVPASRPELGGPAWPAAAAATAGAPLAEVKHGKDETQETPASHESPRSYISPGPEGLPALPQIPAPAPAMASAAPPAAAFAVPAAPSRAPEPPRLFGTGPSPASLPPPFPAPPPTKEAAPQRAGVPPAAHLAASSPSVSVVPSAPAPSLSPPSPEARSIPPLSLSGKPDVSPPQPLAGERAVQRPPGLELRPPAIGTHPDFPAPLPRPGESREEKIHLTLASLLPRIPLELIVRDLPPLDETIRITLPFWLVERQLGAGRVEISSHLFVSVLPASVMHCFASRDGVKVSLPLEEIFQNLPFSPRPRVEQPPPEEAARILAPEGLPAAPPAATSASLPPAPHQAASAAHLAAAPMVTLSPADETPHPAPTAAPAIAAAFASPAPVAPEASAAPVPADAASGSIAGSLPESSAENAPMLTAVERMAETVLPNEAVAATAAAQAAAIMPETPVESTGLAGSFSASAAGSSVHRQPHQVLTHLGPATPFSAEAPPFRSSEGASWPLSPAGGSPEIPPMGRGLGGPASHLAPAPARLPQPPLAREPEQAAETAPTAAPSPLTTSPEPGATPTDGDGSSNGAKSLPTVLPAAHQAPPPATPADPAPVLIPPSSPEARLHPVPPLPAAMGIAPAEGAGAGPAPVLEFAAPASALPAVFAAPNRSVEAPAYRPTLIPPPHLSVSAIAPAPASAATLVGVRFDTEGAISLGPAVGWTPEAPAHLATPPTASPQFHGEVLPDLVAPATATSSPLPTASSGEAVAASRGVESAVPPGKETSTEAAPSASQFAPATSAATSVAPSQSALSDTLRENSTGEPDSPSENLHAPDAAPESKIPRGIPSTDQGGAHSEATAPPQVPPSVPSVKSVVPISKVPDAPTAAGAPAFDQATLQALFMTDRPLDLARVSTLAAVLPGIQACVITIGGATYTGGPLPAGFSVAALRGLAPQVGAAADRLTLGALKNFTLYGDHYSVSFFERAQLCLCAIHRARSFVPGVREKLVAIADGLAGE